MFNRPISSPITKPIINPVRPFVRGGVKSKIWDFSSLPADVTLTRASVANALDSSGVYQQFAANQLPRVWSSAGVDRGALVERASSNVVESSYAHTGWESHVDNEATFTSVTATADTSSAFRDICGQYFAIVNNTGANRFLEFNGAVGTTNTSVAWCHYRLTGTAQIRIRGTAHPSADTNLTGDSTWRTQIIDFPPGNVDNYVQFRVSDSSTLDLAFVQMEPGLQTATSPIITEGSSQTRAASTYQTVFAPWINTSEGTFVLECSFGDDGEGVGYTGTAMAIRASDLNSMLLRSANALSGTAPRWIVGDGSSKSDLKPASAITADTDIKVAACYGAEGVALSIDGSTPLTDDSIQWSGTTTGPEFYFGNQTGGAHMIGTIRRITYYPVQYWGTSLQTLSD